MRVGRTPTDIALLNAAALVQITGGVYERVRLALGGVNMQPLRLHAIEKQLEGQPAAYPVDTQHLHAVVQEGMAEIQPPSDFRASSDYRRVSGMKLAFRVLEEATSISCGRNMFFSEGRA
jgi:carbon-monoxide dehydrogenase medium subunit